MIRFLTFSLLCIANTALADPDRAWVLLGSHHANATTEFEETNPGVFLEWDTEGRHSYSVGAFRNSYGGASVAGAVNYPLFEQEHFTADVFAGLAHYPGDGDRLVVSFGDVVPMLGLRLRYRSLYLLTLPGDGEATDFVVGYGLTFPLQ